MGRLSMDGQGMRMKPYQIFCDASILAATSQPDSHTQPTSWGGLSRFTSRSTHSPCGETSNSLYLRMFLKSEPTKTSATSQFHSSYVSAVRLGSGFRLSS